MSTTTKTIFKGYVTVDEYVSGSPKVFRTWIKPHLHLIAVRHGWYYNPMQVKLFSKDWVHP